MLNIDPIVLPGQVYGQPIPETGNHSTAIVITRVVHGQVSYSGLHYSFEPYFMQTFKGKQETDEFVMANPALTAQEIIDLPADIVARLKGVLDQHGLAGVYLQEGFVVTPDMIEDDEDDFFEAVDEYEAAVAEIEDEEPEEEPDGEEYGHFPHVEEDDE